MIVMKILQSLLIVLISTIITETYAQIPNYAVGDGLVVAANSGLRLRVKPDMKSPTIKVLDFGQVIDVTKIDPHQQDRIGWIDGHWIKVKAGHVSGWVFDGFLSTMSIPDHEDHLCTDCASLIYPLERYILDHYLSECSEELADTSEDILVSSVLYDDGIQFDKSIGEGWYQAEVTFQGRRINEVLNVFRGMLVGSLMRSDFEQSLIFHQDGKGRLNKIEVKLFADGLTIERTGEDIILVKAMILTDIPDYHVINE